MTRGGLRLHVAYVSQLESPPIRKSLSATRSIDSGRSEGSLLRQCAISSPKAVSGCLPIVVSIDLGVSKWRSSISRESVCVWLFVGHTARGTSPFRGLRGTGHESVVLFLQIAVYFSHVVARGRDVADSGKRRSGDGVRGISGRGCHRGRYADKVAGDREWRAGQSQCG